MARKNAPNVSLEGPESVKQQANTIEHRNAKWPSRHISNANLHGSMYFVHYKRRSTCEDETSHSLTWL